MFFILCGLEECVEVVGFVFVYVIDLFVCSGVCCVFGCCCNVGLYWMYGWSFCYVFNVCIFLFEYVLEEDEVVLVIL